MPTKRLPPSADISHLKHQAKDLLKGFRAAQISALQRIREFHPDFTGRSDADIAGQPFALSDALLSIAREYGYASWPRLKSVLANDQALDVGLIHNDRITDKTFARALDFLDEGSADLLDAYLAAHPDLVHRQVTFEGDNYFTEPTLLEFVAENPIRQGQLPDNITDIAKIILDAGAKDNSAALNSALALTASGRIAREAGAQIPLTTLFCDYGAAPEAGLHPALGHGEFAAAEHLISRGAPVDLAAAAALGRESDVAAALATTSRSQLQLGLTWAALHGRAQVVRLLLGAGADPNRYNPQGADSHCTPLHLAALEGHSETVEALVDGGARLDIGDIHHNAAPQGWADHGGHTQISAYLRTQEGAGP